MNPTIDPIKAAYFQPFSITGILIELIIVQFSEINTEKILELLIDGAICFHRQRVAPVSREKISHENFVQLKLELRPAGDSKLLH